MNINESKVNKARDSVVHNTHYRMNTVHKTLNVTDTCPYMIKVTIPIISYIPILELRRKRRSPEYLRCRSV